MTRQSEFEKDLGYVKATLAFEGLDIPDDTVAVYRKYLNGEYTGEEAHKAILMKHNLLKEV